MATDERAARRYGGIAARINYLAQDRPDLAVASCVAAARMSAPRKGDEALLKRIARYLIHTREARTLFQWQDANVDQIIVVTDSDWATCPATRRSRSGGAVFWGTLRSALVQIAGSHCTQQRGGRDKGLLQSY